MNKDAKRKFLTELEELAEALYRKGSSVSRTEAAYSCVTDPSSAPPEEFWPMPWAKPSWEAEEE